jgi:hypothetical protein
MVAGRRTLRMIYNVREQGGSAMTREATENAGVALWRQRIIRTAVLESPGRRR